MSYNVHSIEERGNKYMESFRESFKEAVDNTNVMYSEDGMSKAVHFHENCDGVEVVTFVDLTGPETNIRTYVIDEIEEIEKMYIRHYESELEDLDYEGTTVYGCIGILVVAEEPFKKYCQ